MDRDTLQRLMHSPAEFRRSLLIDVDGRPRRLADVRDDWQEEDFAAMDPAWIRVCGRRGKEVQHSRAYLERPRGHSKTADNAVSAAWAVFAARGPISGIVAAGDKEQARLLRNAIDRLVRLNGWLSQFINVGRDRVSNRRNGAEFQVISSDVTGSWGLTPDAIIVDELSHWPTRDLWDSLMSAAAKRSNCVVCVISNAGVGQGSSWNWHARESCRTSPGWYFRRLDGPVASWMTADRLAEQRQLLPESVYLRLWENVWTEGTASPALRADDIGAALTCDGPLEEPEPHFVYFVGVDASLTNDATAVVCCGVHSGGGEYVESNTNFRWGEWKERIPEREYVQIPGTGRVRVANVRVWRPRPGHQVPLEDVRLHILDLHRRFKLRRVLLDPHQSGHLSQLLRRDRVPAELVWQTGPKLTEQATALVNVFQNQLIDLFDEPDLIGDLRRLQLEEKSYGFRLSTERSATALGTVHGDAASALSIALPSMVNERQKYGGKERLKLLLGIE